MCECVWVGRKEGQGRQCDGGKGCVAARVPRVLLTDY